MMRSAAGVFLWLLVGCSDRASPPPPAQAASAQPQPQPPAPSSAAPISEAPGTPGPRLLTLGYTVTETHRMPRLEWRRWQELHWQGASSGLPPLPSEPAPGSGGCTSGMLRVKGRFVLDTKGRSDTDEVTVLQNQTCTFWRTADRGENGLCDRFDAERWGAQVAALPRRDLDFCIDRYEYPNEKGAHPPVMVSFYDASGLCAAKGKRLCYESEWTAACEGPDELPFPYGWERSAEKCNFDNAWVDPSLKKIYSDDPGVRDAELARLDRSVPSGHKPGCVSGYGVHDLTGNVDEWVLADRDRPEEKGRFSALKGGAWGHVRNACRPVTTSHEPEFTYYFVSFRCCRDPG